MHIVLLVWKNSKFYNAPARLVVLVREIANAVIAAAQRFVSGKAIFELIAEEQAPAAISKLKTTLRVCGDLKRAYFAYKGTAAAECPDNPWRIQNTALFSRLDGALGLLAAGCRARCPCWLLVAMSLLPLLLLRLLQRHGPPSTTALTCLLAPTSRSLCALQPSWAAATTCWT